MMTPPDFPEQHFVGVFLLGTAALAIFDFWFPGVFLLLGACLIAYGFGRDNVYEGLPIQTGFILILSSSVYLLWLWLREITPDFVFPIVIIILSILILSRFKLQRDDE